MSKKNIRPYFQHGDIAHRQVMELMILLGCTSPKQVLTEAISVLYDRETRKVAHFVKNPSLRKENMLD